MINSTNINSSINLSINAKIKNIIADLHEKCYEYNHDIRAKHASVLIKNNKVIGNYKFNYIRNNIIGLECGSAHAEMVALQQLCNEMIHTIGVNISKWNKNRHCLL